MLGVLLFRGVGNNGVDMLRAEPTCWIYVLIYFIFPCIVVGVRVLQLAIDSRSRYRTNFILAFVNKPASPPVKDELHGIHSVRHSSEVDYD